jgi:Putative multicopper oxidases
MVINGKAWPHTETLNLTLGDSVRWRLINPSANSHPMHLHGFYFSVESRGDGRQDTAYAPAMRPLAVTELILPGSTMSMRWAPTRPGNWIFHCHFAFHVSPFASLTGSAEESIAAPDGSHAHSMSGLGDGHPGGTPARHGSDRPYSRRATDPPPRAEPAAPLR